MNVSLCLLTRLALNTSLFGGLILSPLLPLSAQQEKEGFHIKFKALGWNTSAMKLFYFEKNLLQQQQREQAQDPEPIIAPRAAPSEAYTYHGTSPLVFFRKKESQEEGMILEPVARVDIREQNASLLLLFNELDEKRATGEEFLIRSITYEFDQQSGGTIRFLNLSTKKVAGILNEEEFLLEPREQTVVEGRPNQNNNLGLRLAQNKGQGWKKAFGTVLGHRPNMRVVIIITDNAHDEERISLRRFKEHVSGPVPTPENK